MRLPSGRGSGCSRGEALMRTHADCRSVTPIADAESPAVLMVAFHYPPIHISSGVQRTLAFSRYLPDEGWRPLVLTAHPRVDTEPSADLLKEVPANLIVTRAFACDSARHLALRGRYWGLLALPDRWVGWWLGGLFSGLKMIWQQRPKVIFSTYPVATAHLIGLTLQRLTGLPWVADFRDSMTEPNYPREARRRRVYLWLERRVVQAASRVIFTTPGAVRMYQQRYPDLPAQRWILIPNGYNEAIFSELEVELAGLAGGNGAAGFNEATGFNEEMGTGEAEGASQKRRPLTLLHSGLLYPEERDPRCFFSALAALKRSGSIDAQQLNIVLRASGHDDGYRVMLAEYGIEDLVLLAPALDYRAALTEMLQVDGLLILQASGCNHQVPAKIYEYFRAGKPILALTDPAGDTAQTMRQMQLTTIAPLDDSEAIATQLLAFIAAIDSGCAQVASQVEAEKYSRRAASTVLAKLFDDVLDKR